MRYALFLFISLFFDFAYYSDFYCIFVPSTDENVQRMQKEYTILNPQAVAALYQDQ